MSGKRKLKRNFQIGIGIKHVHFSFYNNQLLKKNENSIYCVSSSFCQKGYINKSFNFKWRKVSESNGGAYKICKWIEFPNQGYSQASLFSSSRQDFYMTMAKLQPAV